MPSTRCGKLTRKPLRRASWAERPCHDKESEKRFGKGLKENRLDRDLHLERPKVRVRDREIASKVPTSSRYCNPSAARGGSVRFPGRNGSAAPVRPSCGRR